MKKLALSVLSLVSIAAAAADDKATPSVSAAAVKNPIQFCYMDGKEYSKGYRVVDQTKTTLVCDAPTQWVSGPNDAPRPLEWRIEVGKRVRTLPD